MSLSHNSHPGQVHDKTLRNYLGNTPVSLSISLHPLFWARISAPNTTILPPAVFLIPPGSRRRPAGLHNTGLTLKTKESRGANRPCWDLPTHLASRVLRVR
jgi:hypothetical protein